MARLAVVRVKPQRRRPSQLRIDLRYRNGQRARSAIRPKDSWTGSADRILEAWGALTGKRSTKAKGKAAGFRGRARGATGRAKKAAK